MNLSAVLVTALLSIDCCLSNRLSDELYHLVKLGDGSYHVIPSPSRNPEEDFQRDVTFDFEAKGHYQRLINETGWSLIQLQSNFSKSNEDQAYAIGYLEGFLTSDVIYMHWFNTLGDFCDDRTDLCQKLDEYIKENYRWVESKIASAVDTDEYWHHVKLFYAQIRGLADGYIEANKDANKRLTYENLLWLNLQGDFEDLTEVLKLREKNYDTTGYLPRSALGFGHCSALIKVLPDCSDMFVAQDTWNSFQSMIRLLKKYTVFLRKTENSPELIPGREMSFSSYPGVITSGDDFYLISSGIATLETTIGNGNASLWQFVQPKGQVFEGVRSMVANRLATDGRTWTQIFSRYNSGTYNNQWMIVDYNKFMIVRDSATCGLPDGTLWVLEQIPGYIHAADVTLVLREQTYWPSYNVAAFPDVFNKSGNQDMVRKFGDWFTYDKNPRAQIFKRDHNKVSDLKSMLSLMRYNDFKHDPLSRCDCNPPYSAENAIAARCDLNPTNGTYPFPALGHRQHGATDAKITSSALFFSNLMFMAVSGPPFNESLGIPPFEWSKSDFAATTPHIGHPDKWIFEPIIKQWV